MADKIVLLDTSILIEYYRKKDKSKTTLFRLLQTYSIFVISSVTHFEIYSGSNEGQSEFWASVFDDITILPFTPEISMVAAHINDELKRKRKQIGIADLFISATALYNKYPIATLNAKHFSRIDDLEVLS